MTSETLHVEWSLEPSVVRPVVRELLVVAAILVGIRLGFFLPGTNDALFDTAITGNDVILGVGTLGLVASLVYGAPKMNRLVTSMLTGPDRVVGHVGMIAHALVVFFAVLVAHYGFASVVVPVVTAPWLYDLVFFLIALGPLGIIAYRFYLVLDPVADAITRVLVEQPGTTSMDDEAAADSTPSQ